jgi:hypothetical protein
MTLDNDYCKMPHQPRMSSGVFLSVDADLRHISESEERVERLGNAQNKAMKRSRKSFRDIRRDDDVGDGAPARPARACSIEPHSERAGAGSQQMGEGSSSNTGIRAW